MHRKPTLRKSIKYLSSSCYDRQDNHRIIISQLSRPFSPRKCERSNYVPYREPIYSNKEVWLKAYFPQLKYMYRNIGRMIDIRHPHANIDWTEFKYFSAFVKLIYHFSSKYISPYLDSDEENSSKELDEKSKDGKSKKATE